MVVLLYTDVLSQSTRVRYLDAEALAPHRVAQIVQGAGPDPIPRARLGAFRTRPMLVISTAPDNLRGR